MISAKRLFHPFVKAGNAWIDDYPPSIGPAISCYTMFSLANEKHKFPPGEIWRA